MYRAYYNEEFIGTFSSRDEAFDAISSIAKSRNNSREYIWVSKKGNKEILDYGLDQGYIERNV